MVVGLSNSHSLLPVKGIRLATGAAGIRYNDREDTVLLELVEGTNTAAVFTRNAFCAAPVIVAKKHLASADTRYLLINSGNANAGTGNQGLERAQLSCGYVANVMGLNPEVVLPFSTGVIGEQLPVENFQPILGDLFADLDEDHWGAASRSIMTTDTVPKAFSVQFHLGGKPITMTGMSKGSGMICPNMATMLAYIATDANVEKDILQKLLNEAVSLSFNSITVDGDTSTNDACVLMATGASGVKIVSSDDLSIFREKLMEVTKWLAQAIIRDAEGITKFITLQVEAAASVDEARAVAYTVAHSPLVKTAFFASDANWGRILAAVGRAPVDSLDVSKIDISLGDTCIVVGGEPASGYSEAKGGKAMAEEEITVTIRLGRGDFSATVWTSDLSHDYVSINADYRS